MPYAFVGWIATAGAEGLLAARSYKRPGALPRVSANTCKCALCTTNDWRELEHFAYELGYN